MADPVESSPQWRPEAVLRRLKDEASDGQPVSAQVFMSDSVSPDEIVQKAHEIVNAATSKAGLSADSARVGNILILSKSFSVTTGNPDIFKSIASSHEVKSIIDSKQDDIFPRPLNRISDF